ncbi:MAG: hypothetical protein AAFN59_13580 [Pseudomonadota bacterium]
MELSGRATRLAVMASAFAILPTATLVFNPTAAQAFGDFLANASIAEPLYFLADLCLPDSIMSSFAAESMAGGMAGGMHADHTAMTAGVSLMLLAIGAGMLRRSKAARLPKDAIDDGRILAAMCYVARASGGMETKELGRIFTQVTGHIATPRQLATAYRAFNAEQGGMELTPFRRATSDAERTAIMTAALRVAWSGGRMRQTAQHLISLLARAMDMSETRVMELFDTVHNPPRKRWV